MIDHVILGVLTYDVYEADKNQEPDPDLDPKKQWMLGEIAYGKQCIYINTEQHNDVKRVTLLHEVIHGILHQAGHYKARDDEGLVNALAFSLVQLIRDNPHLVAYLTE